MSNIPKELSNLTNKQIDLLDSALSSFRTAILRLREGRESEADAEYKWAKYQLESAEEEWQDGLLELTKMDQHHGDD